MKAKIADIFVSIQGEELYAGQKQIFVLLIFFICLFGFCQIIHALNPTPIRIALLGNDSYTTPFCGTPKTYTTGLDLGILSAGTCRVAGIQVAPYATANVLYGLQFGLVSLVDDGYGIQIGVLGSGHMRNFYGIQLSGVNFSEDGVGIQAGVINIHQMEGTGTVQIGGYNQADSNLLPRVIQIGIINVAGSVRIAQIGIINDSGETRGVQVGIVNRAQQLYGLQLGLINIIPRKLHKLGLPFTPIINFSW